MLRHPEPVRQGVPGNLSVDFATSHLQTSGPDVALSVAMGEDILYLLIGSSSLSGLWFGVAIYSVHGIRTNIMDFLRTLKKRKPKKQARGEGRQKSRGIRIRRRHATLNLACSLACYLRRVALNSKKAESVLASSWVGTA